MTEELSGLWQQVKVDLRPQFIQQNYTDLIEPTYPLGFEDGILTIHAQTGRDADVLNHRWLPTITRTARRTFRDLLEIKFSGNGLSSPSPPSPVSIPNIGVTTEGPLPEDLITDDSFEPPKIATFDPAKGGYSKHDHYSAQFRRAYMSSLYGYGTVAFSVWDYLRAQHKDSGPWSPVMTIDPKELAWECAKIKGPQPITGATRKCRNFNGDFCCAAHPGIVKDGSCRYHVPGALDLLARERMAAISITGRTKAKVYRVQIYQHLPLLTPTQAGRLDQASQQRHTTWLKEARIYRDWLQYQDCPNFLHLAIDRAGLELPLL